jgi:hypothetical protein
VNGDVVGFEWAFRDADINDRLPWPMRPDLSSTAPYDRQQSLTVAQSLIHDPAVVAPAPNMPNLQQPTTLKLNFLIHVVSLRTNDNTQFTLAHGYIAAQVNARYPPPLQQAALTQALTYYTAHPPPQTMQPAQKQQLAVSPPPNAPQAQSLPVAPVAVLSSSDDDASDHEEQSDEPFHDTPAEVCPNGCCPVLLQRVIQFSLLATQRHARVNKAVPLLLLSLIASSLRLQAC